MAPPNDLGCCGKPAGEVCIHDLYVPPEEVERLTMCAWLRANNIDPKTVPLHDHQLRITEHDGQRLISYTAFTRDKDTGNLLFDSDRQGPVTSEATVPCLVEPEASLNIPGGRP